MTNTEARIDTDDNSTTIPEAVTSLRDLAMSAAAAAALRAAVRLGIAEVIDDRPVDTEKIADALGVQAPLLERLLRTLKYYGVFAPTENGHVHTPISRLLREDHPQSLKYHVLWATEPWTWALWPHLDEAVRTGRNVFDDLYGQDFFTHLHAQWPESTEVFNKSQTQLSTLSAATIAERLDLSGVGTLADIAGGHGYMLATLLERHPDLQGVLFDLPQVVADPDPRLTADGALAPRARLVGGDCLRAIPVDADLYLFKSILEWDDEKSVIALRNARKSGRPGARVVIITNLIDDSPEIRYTTGADLLFLLNSLGKKHTTATLRAIAERAGLVVNDIRPINSYLHVLDAVIPG